MDDDLVEVHSYAIISSCPHLESLELHRTGVVVMQGT